MAGLACTVEALSATDFSTNHETSRVSGSSNIFRRMRLLNFLSARTNWYLSFVCAVSFVPVIVVNIAFDGDSSKVNRNKFWMVLLANLVQVRN